MLIKPNKRSEKIYTISKIEDNLVLLVNDYGDEKTIETYEFDLQNIIPEIGKNINLVQYDEHGCSVIENFDEE